MYQRQIQRNGVHHCHPRSPRSLARPFCLRDSGKSCWDNFVFWTDPSDVEQVIDIVKDGDLSTARLETSTDAES